MGNGSISAIDTVIVLAYLLGIMAVGILAGYRKNTSSDQFLLREFSWYSILFGYLGIWYWCTDQTIVQKVLAAETEKDGRNGAIFAGFLEILPVFRPKGYNPFDGGRFATRQVVSQLGKSGQDCFAAIKNRDVDALGASFNLCSSAWRKMLPAIFEHPTSTVPVMQKMRQYQRKYAGAMPSGCGVGYIYVASSESPGGIPCSTRTRSNLRREINET